MIDHIKGVLVGLGLHVIRLVGYILIFAGITILIFLKSSVRFIPVPKGVPRKQCNLPIYNQEYREIKRIAIYTGLWCAKVIYTSCLFWH